MGKKGEVVENDNEPGSDPYDEKVLGTETRPSIELIMLSNLLIVADQICFRNIETLGNQKADK